MKNSRSSDDKTDTWSSRHVPVYTRSIAAGLLIAECHESDAKIDGFFGDLHYWDSHDAEDHGDA